MKTVSGSQMRKIEQVAIDELGIPSILLMENAANRLAEHCFRIIDERKNSSDQISKILIICGQGNNGGDGMALARLLHLKGVDTKIIYTGDTEKAKGDAAVYLEIIKKLSIPLKIIPLTGDLQEIKNDIETHDLVIDAMFGTGLDRNVEGNFKSLTEAINCYAKYVISADIPSGINSDNGRVMGCAVKASETVTFGFPKTGLYIYPGAEYAGKIHIEDITIPHSLINRIDIDAEILAEKEARALLPVRKQRSNKGDYGRIIVFAGSNEMPGAAALACSASYKTGGGLVSAYVLPNVAKVIQNWQREVITHFVPEKNGMYCKKSIENLKEEINSADVIVAGPGIGRNSDVTEFVRELIYIAEVPLVLDADALFAVSENLSILKEIKAPCVITPHPGEMSRLTGLSVQEILNNISGTAVRFSREYNVITLLKDAHTIIAKPDGRFNINITGNNALSKAGTGDVLTGMIAGYIAQYSQRENRTVSETDIFNACILGAYYHGKSGEAAARNKSCYSVTAEDLLTQGI